MITEKPISCESTSLWKTFIASPEYVNNWKISQKQPVAHFSKILFLPDWLSMAALRLIHYDPGPFSRPGILCLSNFPIACPWILHQVRHLIEPVRCRGSTTRIGSRWKRTRSEGILADLARPVYIYTGNTWRGFDARHRTLVTIFLLWIAACTAELIWLLVSPVLNFGAPIPSRHRMSTLLQVQTALIVRINFNIRIVSCVVQRKLIVFLKIIRAR